MSNYYQIFAQVKDTEVLNTAVFANYTIANQITKLTHGETAFAVHCNNFKVAPGCYYKDGTFYREDGETPCEQNFNVHQCKEQIEELQDKYKADIAFIAMQTNVELEQ